MAHLDDLALNAHLDGDADHGEHLDGCDACLGRLASLRSVAQAVGVAPPGPSPSAADQLIAAALAAAPPAEGDEEATVVSLAERRMRRTRWLAAAAVVLILLAAVPVILSGREGGGTDMAARMNAEARQPAPEEDAAALASGVADDAEALGSAGGSAAAGGGMSGGPISDGDLGPRSDVAELERIARARLDTPSGGDDVAPVVVRCEDDARAALGVSGSLIYLATLRWRGTDAEVVVFREADGSRPLAIMSRSGCRLLDRGRT